MAPRLVASIFLALTLLGAAPGPKGLRASANRMAGEGSPYLALHAADAVQWYGWGDEAFAKAKREGKPLFLSIGYASCHWCHVLQRESFVDPEIARLLNTRFVPVLVDREERPDVDATYIAFVEAMNDGVAGWPANLVLTPDLEPLTGTSYVSRERLQSMLESFDAKWTSDRASLLVPAAEVLAQLRAKAQRPGGSAEGAPQLVERVYQRYRDAVDTEHGGFGGAPKFPQPAALDFLFRYAVRTNSASAEELVKKNLRALAAGAVHDQVGGGFHRYAVDAAWRMPHFEKMLADQALLAMVYTEFWQLRHDPADERVARRALDYVLRTMRDKEGGFAAAEDSDSLTPIPGSPQVLEGAHYTWTTEEIAHVVGKQRVDLVTYAYGLKPVGNVPEGLDPAGAFKGQNVLALVHSDEELRKRFGLTQQQLDVEMEAALAKLQLVREHRPRPARDEKIVTSWNGLMISALARGGVAFGQSSYIDAARTAARFAQGRLYDSKSHTLVRRVVHGKAGGAALTEDYAFLIQGLIDLYEATFTTRWLELAIDLQQRQDELFWDGAGMRYSAGGSVPPLLRDAVAERDGATPSVNAISALNLIRLGDMVDSEPWRARASAILTSFATRMQSNPAELPSVAATLTVSLAPPKQIVIVGDPGADDTKAMLRAAGERFTPRRSLFLVYGGPSQEELARYVPLVKEMKALDKHATAYVCEKYICKAPTSDLQTFIGML
jgi:uncharacterized protein YyaL (SSP411 family)